MRALAYRIFTKHDEIIEVRSYQQMKEIVAELRSLGDFKEVKDVMLPMDEQRNIIYPDKVVKPIAKIVDRKAALEAWKAKMKAAIA